MRKGLTVEVIVLPRLLVVVMTFPPPMTPPDVPLVLEVPFVPDPLIPEVPLPLLLLPVATAAPVVVVYVEPALSVVVMTPPAPAPPAETAVVPVRTV